MENQKSYLIYSSATRLGIEMITWSSIGDVIAFADVNGQIDIRRLENCESHSKETSWKLVPARRFLFNRSALEGIRQFMLSPDGDFLFVSNPPTFQTWDVGAAHVATESKSDRLNESAVWIGPSTTNRQVLHLTQYQITTYDWDRGQISKCNVSNIGGPATQGINNGKGFQSESHGGDNQPEPGRSHEEALSIIESIEEGWSLVFIRRRGTLYKLIDLSALRKNKDSSNVQIPAMEIPSELSSSIRFPLAILNNELLVYIDHTLWANSWRFSSEGSESAHVRKPVCQFFIPRDWIDAESLNLCKVLSDGTFICPRKGHLMIIKSNLGSDW